MEQLHDLISLAAMLLAGILGSLLVAPSQRAYAVVRNRITHLGDIRNR